jgi:hypothetical protein
LAMYARCRRWATSTTIRFTHIRDFFSQNIVSVCRDNKKQRPTSRQRRTVVARSTNKVRQWNVSCPVHVTKTVL